MRNDPHGVLQAGEGALPASLRAPRDHGEGGGSLHELPRRLPPPREPADDTNRQAGRQRGAGAARTAYRRVGGNEHLPSLGGVPHGIDRGRLTASVISSAAASVASCSQILITRHPAVSSRSVSLRSR